MTMNRRVVHRVRSPLRSPRLNSSSLRKKALLKRLSGDVQFGADTKANLKVVVRVRPFSQREEENNANCILDVVDEHMLVFDPRRDEDTFFFKGAQQRTRDLTKRQPREQKFAFERVFSTASTNEDIYNASTHDLLDTLLSGYNCSVFAYGATGAGKTFTMLGTEECPGITFLTLKELYQRIDALKEKTFEVAVSYLEVYNETVRDLLSTGKPLSVQEMGKQVLVPGLSLHKPEDAQELMQILVRGNLNRTQHPTDSNAESSRSHAVFQVFVKQHDRVATNLKSNVAISKLSMIDLAGSERGAATGFKGARFREGASINKSLLALGNCINALADGQRHIPYRDSKLTRLLKDSLGGNCRSVMIAAVSPASSTFEDTFNTLRYANRAKTIKTTIRKNVLNVDQHVSNYVKIVEGLREEIRSLQAKIKMYEEKEMEQGQAAASASPQPECTQQQKQELEARILDLEMQLKTRNTEEGENGTSEVEAEVQQKVDGAIQKHKKLRHELLRLENSQRELEFKMKGCTARLNRMKIISFASQKLDKSISRCERTIRNLASRLVEITSLKQEIRTKLTASVDHLQEVQSQLTSSVSKQYMEANLALRDYHQHCQYLGGLMGEAFVEQNTSEHLICQLLRAIRQFYIQHRADNQCSPAFSEIFKSVVDNLDESKIAWADQQGGKNIGEQQQGGGDDGALRGEISNCATSDASAVPQLDVKYFTSLPITPSVTISPVVTQGQPRIRKSSMKTSTSALTLPQLPTQCLVSSQDSRHTFSLSRPFLEEEEEVPISGQPSAGYSSSVISVPHRSVPMSTVSCGMEQVDEQQYVAGKVPHLSVKTAHTTMPDATTSSTTPQLVTTPFTLQSVSSSQQYYTTISNSTVDALNVPDVLNIQPVKCCMNETFSATPVKTLNTTIDLPSSSAIMQNTLPDAEGSTIRSDTNFSQSDKFQGTQGQKDIVTSVFGFTSLTQQFGVAAGSTIGGVIDHGTEILKGNSLNETFSLAPNLPGRESIPYIYSSPTRMPSVMKEDVPSAPRPALLSFSCDNSQETESYSRITSDASSNHHKTSESAEQTAHSAMRMLFPPSKFSLDSTFRISEDKSPAELEQIPGIPMKSAGAMREKGREHSSCVGEVEQRLPLQPLSDSDKNDQTGLLNSTSSTVSSTGWERVMQPPPKVKLKHGLSHTPHKLNKNTPGKLGGSRTTSTFSMSKTSDGSMRRSVSTPSLAASLAAASTSKTPTITRKFSGLHRSSSTLKVRSAIHNQENVSPSSAKKNASCSSVYRDTVSSAAKYAVNIRKQ